MCDREVDIVSESFDLALRIGTLTSSSLMARRLTSIHRHWCASPAYLAKHGIPQTLADLQDHALLRYSLRPVNDLLLYTDTAGKQQTLDMPIKLSANNGTFLMEAAIAGHGMALLPTFITYRAVQTGKLQVCLTHYQWNSFDLYAVYPPTHHVSHRVRVLIDFLQARFAPQAYWDGQ